ncbi:MAG: benzoyl-CoA reductase subunit C [Armatimonadetes bacterium]|nr:benzoyl-CoA reductase subunit C [Armatimonadota bacterium]
MEDLVGRAEGLAYDLEFTTVRQWKEKNPTAMAVGILPVYAPREILHASGHLPVGIVGGGDRLEIIRGDAYFQSYICRLPRSVIELALSGRLDCIEGFLFPSICDVIRNLSGMFQVLFPDRYVHYFDYPQNFDPAVGGRFYRRELERLVEDFGARASAEDLRRSIRIYNQNRRAIRALYELRGKQPWKLPASEVYVVVRAGNVLPVAEHTRLVEDYATLAEAASDRPQRDHVRVVLCGGFCEQPPLGLIRTLERAGCYVVEDDLTLGPRWITADVEEEGDPLEALTRAFLEHSVETASLFKATGEKGEALVEAVRRTGAQGVIFASPSFCDPALLDRPMMQAAMDRAGIPHTSFKYAENLGQFHGIREQAGTFSDSIRLWGQA